MHLRNSLGVLSFIVGLMCAVLVGGSQVQAAQVAVVTTSALNIRSGAGTNYDIVGSVRQGDRMNVVATSNGWYKVTFGNVTGWVIGSYVRLEGTSVSTPGTTSQVAVVTGSEVNLRSGAGTNHGIAGQCSQGDRLVVLGKSGDWLNVKTKSGVTGWVASWLVKVETVSASAPAPSGSSSQVAVITGKTVNLRSGAGTNYGIAGQCSQGDRLVVLGKSGDWLNVKTKSGVTGWVANWLARVETVTTPASPPPPSTGTANPSVTQVEVTGNGVNLRTGPGTSYNPPVGTVAKGTRLAVLGKNGSWYKVKIPNSTGQAYIFADLVKPVAAPVPEPPPSEPAKPHEPPVVPEDAVPPPADVSSAVVGKTAQVAVGVIDIREGASMSSRSTASASKGSALPIIGVSGQWLQIRTPGGTTGWIKYSEVTIVDKGGVSRGDDPIGNEIRTKTEVLNGKTRVIIEASQEIEYDVFALRNPYRVVVDIASEASPDLPGDLTSNSSLIKAVRTGWQEEEGKIRVVAELAGTLVTTRYKATLAPDKRTLVVEFWKVNGVLDDRTVVIDPGHGGSEPGATSKTGLQEKVVNLAVGLEVARLLEQQGIDVVLTRSTDQYVSLQRRTEIATEASADVFVSIHCNSHTSSQYHGTSTWYSPQNVFGNATERYRLSCAVQDEMIRILGRNDSGVRTDAFYVTKYTAMPSCLVEMAFLSNPEEDALLWSDEFRDGAAHAIATGIINYLKSLE